uniref:ORF7 protein n=1 Tax=Miniopterus bat coronavirus TaxID=3119327 RepID=A0AB38ZDN8_9NIDO
MFVLLFLSLFSVAFAAPVHLRRRDEGCFSRLLACRRSIDFNAAQHAALNRESFLLPHKCLIYVGFCEPDLKNLLSHEVVVMVPIDKPDGTTTFVQQSDLQPIAPESYALLHTALTEMHNKIASRSKPVMAFDNPSAAAEAYVGTNSHAHPTEESSTPS